MSNNIFSKRFDELVEKTNDLSKYTDEQLEILLHESNEIMQEYNNLQLVVKCDANSLYGVSASIFYSLCDFDVAEDITMGGKFITCTVDKSLNKLLLTWGEPELKIIQQFYPDVIKLKQFTQYVPDTKNDFCVYGDTDSRYCDIGLIYKLMETSEGEKQIPTDDKELSDFSNFFNKHFVEETVKNGISLECEKRNIRKGFLRMVHEINGRKSIFLKKKKYIITAIEEDGKFLGKRKLKLKGVELRKGSMSPRMKKILLRLVEKFLIEDNTIEKLRLEVLKIITYIKQQKQKDLIYSISSVSGINNMRLEGDKYVSDKNHIQMQIALSWANFIKENNLKEMRLPFNGQKMNYYYCAQGQKYKVIGVPDDIDINKVKNLPEPDWNKMIIMLLVKPLLRYIYDQEEISDVDCEHFLLGVKKLKF